MDEREFVARGTVELHGVTFFIKATSQAEAEAKAKAGDYEFYEADAAETVNWGIDPDSVEPNV